MGGSKEGPGGTPSQRSGPQLPLNEIFIERNWTSGVKI